MDLWRRRVITLITEQCRSSSSIWLSGKLWFNGDRSSVSSAVIMHQTVLRSHGIASTSLQDVFRATVVAKVTYCAPAWSGTCSAADRARLDSFLNRCKRLGFNDKDLSSVTDLLFSAADDAFFERIVTNSEHCATTVITRETWTVITSENVGLLTNF